LPPQLRMENSSAVVLNSNKGGLPWAEVMQALAQKTSAVTHSSAQPCAQPPQAQLEEALEGHHHGDDHGHSSHAHNAQVRFVPLPDNLTFEELRDQGQACLTPALRRLKGVVCLDGQLTTVQWSPGDADMQLSAFGGDTSDGTNSKPTTQPPPKPPQLGWTCIEDL